MGKTLYMTRGLPGSGKSSWASQQVAQSKGQIKKVSKDDLRVLLDGGDWSSKNEKTVLAVRDTIIGTVLDRGFSIIVDDTNLQPPHEPRLRNLAAQFGAEFVIKDFTDVPLEECLKRDRARKPGVGPNVILSMWHKYLAPEPPKRPEFDYPRKAAYIFDLDGTLADMGDRNPFDASTCYEDAPREGVIELLQILSQEHFILLVSGRHDTWREQTERWLNLYEIPYEELHMRQAGDNRKDFIIKKEIFENEIEPHYNVRGVIDDRPSVLRMWKYELGLPTFNVGDGVEF